MLERALQLARGRVQSSVERDRSIEPHVEAISRRLWPWEVTFLIPIVSLVAAMDHLSTYIALNLAASHAYESGLLARWALRQGGFNGLLLMDAAAVGLLVLVAAATRLFYLRFGFKGFGRTAFVLVLVPYVTAAGVAVVNNVVMILLSLFFGGLAY